MIEPLSSSAQDEPLKNYKPFGILHIVCSVGGGVGKTTIAQSLVVALNKRTKHIYTIDMNFMNNDLMIIKPSEFTQSRQQGNWLIYELRQDEPKELGNIKYFCNKNIYKMYSTNEFWDSMHQLREFGKETTDNLEFVVDTNSNPANLFSDLSERSKSIVASFEKIVIWNIWVLQTFYDIDAEHFMSANSIYNKTIDTNKIYVLYTFLTSMYLFYNKITNNKMIQSNFLMETIGIRLSNLN